MNDQKVSKFISYILRHKPEDIGLDMDSQGWVNVGDLIEKSKPKYAFDLNDLKRIVDEDAKGRYSFSDDGLKIRANQGHSKMVNPDLKERTPPEFLYHGTPEQFQKSIEVNGINKGSRTYVHLSSDVETATAVARRRGRPVVFAIYTPPMVSDGVKFFLSDNGVWLVDYVDQRYLSIAS